MTCEFCDRQSALPEPYPPRCGRHYMQDVKEAEARVERRMIAARKALEAGDRPQALKILHTPLEEFAKPIKR
jgi:hypothetical protein